ncbi:TerD family protein [Brevibacillus sp. SYSU BS000544]|uniref:TerD family protein n=1 Tax=Brevibacillus sp. SYSU BS000544 TaxID=3416443 RepID=UPI003CE4C905
MSVISLTKGQKIDLTKGNPNLTKVHVGLGWDTNKYSGQHAFDLDAAAFLLRTGDKATGIQDFVFYNNLKGINDCVIHRGDNLTGEGDGDDEVIKVDFSKVPADIQKIAFTVTIHDGQARNQNFGQVSNAFVRVLDDATGREILRYDLGEDFSIETAIVVCEIYRHGAEWKFSAVGSGFSGGLQALCANFGLQAG